MKWVGYVVLATIATVAVSFLLLILNNSSESGNGIVKGISISLIAVVLTFVAAAVIVGRARYRF